MKKLHFLPLMAIAALFGGCDAKPKPKPAQASFDLSAQCERLGKMAETSGILSPELAPENAENCRSQMTALNQASPSAFKTQSNCLMAAKDYPDAQS